MTTDGGDFTVRRLRRSIVEKRELEREIFMDIQTIPLKKGGGGNLKMQQEKKNKSLSKNAGLKC